MSKTGSQDSLPWLTESGKTYLDTILSQAAKWILQFPQYYLSHIHGHILWMTYKMLTHWYSDQQAPAGSINLFHTHIPLTLNLDTAAD